VWKQGKTFGCTNEELQTVHLLLEPTKLLPPNGEVDNPEVELAEPVLALSSDEEELVAEDTPEDEKVWG